MQVKAIYNKNTIEGPIIIMEREWPFLHGVRSILDKAVALPIPHTVAQGHTVASGPMPRGKFWNESKHTHG